MENIDLKDINNYLELLPPQVSRDLIVKSHFYAYFEINNFLLDKREYLLFKNNDNKIQFIKIGNPYVTKRLNEVNTLILDDELLYIKNDTFYIDGQEYRYFNCYEYDLINGLIFPKEYMGMIKNIKITNNMNYRQITISDSKIIFSKDGISLCDVYTNEYKKIISLEEILSFYNNILLNKIYSLLKKDEKNPIDNIIKNKILNIFNKEE